MPVEAERPWNGYFLRQQYGLQICGEESPHFGLRLLSELFALQPALSIEKIARVFKPPSSRGLRSIAASDSVLNTAIACAIKGAVRERIRRGKRSTESVENIYDFVR